MAWHAVACVTLLVAGAGGLPAQLAVRAEHLVE
jgi:hypothetical protein